MSRIPRSRLLTALAATVTLLALSACGPTGSESERVKPDAPLVYPQLQTYPDIRVTENVVYGTAGTEPLLLDVCHPNDDSLTNAGPRRAVISVHGGSWRAGDKANINWRSVCQWLASEGFVTFSINYRLVPVYTYPTQIEDVRAAVRWLRQPEQAANYDVDPDRIGAFGGSAGGNLVALLGLEGTGDWGAGSRVAAVVDLSGPVDLTAAGAARGDMTPAFQEVEAAYLGCPSLADCPQARLASPLYSVDRTDPPFFVANSTKELIPLVQSEDLVEALREHGIDTTFVTVKGTLHSIAVLDAEMKIRIASFLRAKLGVAAPPR